MKPPDFAHIGASAGPFDDRDCHPHRQDRRRRAGANTGFGPDGQPVGSGRHGCLTTAAWLKDSRIGAAVDQQALTRDVAGVA